MKRSALAFLVAPFPAALFQSACVAIWPKTGMGVFEHPQSMFVLICLIFYASECIFGLPLYFARRKRLPENALPYALTGAFIGLAPIIVPISIAAGKGAVSTYVLTYNLAFFALGGVIAGLVFWRVTNRRRQETSLLRTFS